MEISVMTVMAPDYKIEDLVPLIGEIGYNAIEPAVGYGNALWDGKSQWHVSLNDLEKDLRKLKLLCDANEIRISSLASNIAMDDTDVFERFCKAATEVNCPCIRLGNPVYDGTGRYNDLFEKALKSLAKVEKIATRYKIKGVIETHMNLMLASASAAYRLVSNFDPDYVGLIYDPANAMVEGWEKYGIDLLDKYIANVHVKNMSWRQDKGGNMDYFCDGNWRWSFSGISEGLVNWPAIIRALKSINYGHTLSVEDYEGGYFQVPKGMTTEGKLRADFNSLQKILKGSEDACRITH